MTSIATCPELQDLAKFVLRQLARGEIEAVAGHLIGCERCLATVNTLKGGGTLPGGRRMPAGVVPAMPAAQLVQGWLDEQNVELPTRANAKPARSLAALKPSVPPGANPPTTRPKPMQAAAQVVIIPPTPYPFLGPAQGPGELGRLGSYRILKTLGAGGMGMVFEAEDTQLKRSVALKVMLPDYSSNETSRARFLREARAAAGIEHDRIVTIYQVGEDCGLPFIAMQLLRGESLVHRLQREKRLPIADVLRIGRELAEGLAAAHERGLIHRDIKPSNIWLEGERGRTKLLDFGLARSADDTQLTKTGAVMGTPDYMSPEQARGKPLDARSDLFSLGSVLYDMCAGQAPFHADETMAVLVSVATDTPRAITELNAEVPELLAILIRRLLAKHPDDRPQTARQVVQALAEIEKHLLSGTESGLRRLNPHARTQKATSSARLVFGCALAAALSFACFFYANDISRFFKRTVAGWQHVERLPK